MRKEDQEAAGLTIVDVSGQHPDFIGKLADLTHHAFRNEAPDWLPTLSDARVEVVESLQSGRKSRALLDDSGEPVGWIGVIPRGSGRIWEIHPIAIREDRQGRGYGRILVEDIECLADAASGVLTLFVGVGDNTGRTSLAAADLYADPVSALRHKACEGPHPYRFWQSMGFRIVGVMPDGEGTDRHGIHLVKPVPGRQSPQ